MPKISMKKNAPPPGTWLAIMLLAGVSSILMVSLFPVTSSKLSAKASMLRQRFTGE